MAVKKSFQVLSDLLVFNSIEPTIETIPTDGYNGAHRYRVKLCNGFNKETQTADYVDKTVTLQFVHKNEDGTIIDFVNGIFRPFMIMPLKNRFHFSRFFENPP